MTVDTGRGIARPEVGRRRAGPGRRAPSTRRGLHAKLGAERPVIQRSLFDPYDEDDPARDGAGAQGAAGSSDGTFDDVVSGTWRQLVAAHAATCLVCGGELHPRWSSGPQPVGGVCRSCGTEIA